MFSDYHQYAYTDRLPSIPMGMWDDMYREKYKKSGVHEEYNIHNDPTAELYNTPWIIGGISPKNMNPKKSRTGRPNQLRRPKLKPAPQKKQKPTTKGINGRQVFQAIESYIQSRDAGEFGYYLALLDPSRGVARYPSVIPIPTAVKQIKGMFTITTGGACARVSLAPNTSGTNIIQSYSDASTSDTALGTLVAQLSRASVVASMNKYRCTGASLRYIPVAASDTSTGYGSVAFYPNGTIATAADTIRDSDTVIHFKILEDMSYTWRPMDSADTDLGAGGNSNVSAINYAFSGLATGTPLTFQYVINYEFIPLDSETDLYDCATVQGQARQEVVAAISNQPSMWRGGADLAKRIAGRVENYVVGKALDVGHKILGDPLGIVAALKI